MKTTTLIFPAIAAFMLGSCKQDTFLTQRYTHFSHAKKHHEKHNPNPIVLAATETKDPQPGPGAPAEMPPCEAPVLASTEYDYPYPLTASIPTPKSPIWKGLSIPLNPTNKTETTLPLSRHTLQSLKEDFNQQQTNSHRRGLIFGVINLILFIVIIAVIVALIITLVAILV